MNILHITTYLQGGAGRVICDLAIHQKKLGHRVMLVTTKHDEIGYCNYPEYIKSLEQCGVKVEFIDSTFKREYALNFSAISLVNELIDKNHIDIIHTHAAIPSMIGLIAKCTNKTYNLPIVQTMHGWGRNKSVEHELVDTQILNAIDQIITVSSSDKELLESKGVSNSIQVIYNGVELEQIEGENEDEVKSHIASYRERGYKVIGCIGSVCNRKNQKLLIEAASKINEKIFIALIGEIDESSGIEEIVNSYEKKVEVKLFGYKKNASQYIKYFDMLCLPSQSEGMPIVIMEAFREKVAVICSDIKCHQELITDGEEGYLFKNNICDSLSQVIEVCIRDKNARAKIEKAYKKYETLFMKKETLRKYDDLYERIIEKSQKGIID